jgi:hypothetical protein
MGQKNHSRLLLLSLNSKLSHFDKNINLNLNLNHKCLSPTWRKPIWFLIYGKARGNSELAQQIYDERLPQKILPDSRTIVNVVQHLRNCGHFEMNKCVHCDLGRQREDRI